MSNHSVLHREDFLWPEKQTGDKYHDVRVELERRYYLYEAAEADEGLQAWLLERCSNDYFFWRANFLWTQDVLDPYLKDMDIIPALQWEYQVDFASLYLGLRGRDLDISLPDNVPDRLKKLHKLAEMGDAEAADMLATAAKREGIPVRLRNFLLYKSREMGATVEAASCSTWRWLFAPRAINHYFVSQDAKKVDDNTASYQGSIFGKIRCHIHWLPEWMRPSGWSGPTPRPRFLDKDKQLINPDNGCMIVGASNRPDSVRTWRGERLTVDEANSIEWLEDLLEAAHSVAAVTQMSSVKGMDTYFAQQCLNKVEGLEVHKYGSHYGKSGYTSLKWHFSIRPDRKPGTEAGDNWREWKKSQVSESEWQQEWMISFLRSQTGIIFHQYDPDIHLLTQQEWYELEKEGLLGTGTTIESWDFGHYCAVVWGEYFEASKTLYVTDCRVWVHEFWEDIVADIAEMGWYCEPNPDLFEEWVIEAGKAGRMPDIRIGDPSMYQRSGRDQRTWKGDLEKRGIELTSKGAYDVLGSERRVNEWFAGGRIILSPKCTQTHDKKAPALAVSLTQYKKGKTENWTENKSSPHPKDTKGEHSHAPDALRYAIDYLDSGRAYAGTGVRRWDDSQRRWVSK